MKELTKTQFRMEKSEVTKSVSELNARDYEYSCKVCGFKLFKGNQIIHNVAKSYAGLSLCNAIYVKYLPWMGNLKTNMGKIFCPNSKCNSILGFCNQSGGKCSCGIRLDKMYLIYPLRVTTAKSKITNQTLTLSKQN